MKKNYNIIIVLLSLLVISLLIFPVWRAKAGVIFAYGSRSIEGGFSTFGRGVANSFSFVGRISHLAQENNELTAKITLLEVDKSQISELQIENDTLKKELGFLDQSEQGTLIPARIIGSDPINYLDYLIVDKGQDDGVTVNQPVVSSGVLVGVVSDVYKDSAKIRLITSKDSLVQVMLQNSRAKGLLRGGISGLFVDNITYDTEYSPGEDVVTSGLGGTIEAGILVGKAGKTQSSPAGIYKTIVVDPIVDISKLEIVFIKK